MCVYLLRVCVCVSHTFVGAGVRGCVGLVFSLSWFCFCRVCVCVCFVNYFYHCACVCPLVGCVLVCVWVVFVPVVFVSCLCMSYLFVLVFPCVRVFCSISLSSMQILTDKRGMAANGPCRLSYFAPNVGIDALDARYGTSNCVLNANVSW